MNYTLHAVVALIAAALLVACLCLMPTAYMDMAVTIYQREPATESVLRCVALLVVGSLSGRVMSRNVLWFA